jgi:predicted anti-sigma-YlaC factor YlaD
MDCRQFLQELPDYMDGDAAIGIKEAIQEHLAFCRKCEVLYNSTQKTVQIVSDYSQATFELPEDASARLYSRLQERLKQKPPAAE